MKKMLLVLAVALGAAIGHSPARAADGPSEEVKKLRMEVASLRLDEKATETTLALVKENASYWKSQLWDEDFNGKKQLNQLANFFYLESISRVSTESFRLRDIQSKLRTAERRLAEIDR